MNKAIKVLEQEVAWHKDNPDKAIGMSEDWINGFIKGCEHCLAILVKCEDAVLTPAAPDSEGRAVFDGEYFIEYVEADIVQLRRCR